MIGSTSLLKSGTELPHLNFKFIQQVYRLVRIAFVAEPRRAALLAVFMMMTAIGQKFLEYYTGLIPSHFYGALQTRRQPAFLHVLAKALCFVCGIAVVKALATFCSQLVYITWRKNLVLHIQQLYTSNNAFFDVNCIGRPVDNPDQRITQDVDRFCNQFSQQLILLILAPFTIAFYSYKTWTQVGWFAPVFVYIFFLVGVAVNRLLVSFIVPYVVEQEKLEGDFRYHHVQLRNHAESVAFYGAGVLEGQKLQHTFLHLFRTQRRIVVRSLFLLISVNVFDYLGAILSYIIIAIPILAGAYSDSELSSVISRASFQTIYLIFQFTSLLDVSNSFSKIAAYVYRINGLLDAVEPVPKHRPPHASETHPGCGTSLCRLWRSLRTRLCCSETRYDRVQLVQSVRVNSDEPAGGDGDTGYSDGAQPGVHDWTQAGGEPVFHLESVCYRPPSRQAVSPLVTDLNLDIFAKSGLLITGRSGTGKSSLLRVLRGLWTHRGNVWQRRRGQDAVLYLPQRPFLTQGCLAQQIVYPSSLSSVGLFKTASDADRLQAGNGNTSQPLTSPASGGRQEPLLDSVSVVDSNDGPLMARSAEEKIIDVLESVGLGYLVERAGGSVLLDKDWQWYAALSPGETQRLAFARLLFQQPAIAFLDEATSTLDDDTGYDLMSQCRNRDITLVAVAHHRTSYEKEFFSRELRFDGAGGWTLKPL